MLKPEIEAAIRDLPAILDVPEVCSFLRVSSATVRRELHRAGGIRGYIADGEWCIARADLADYLERNATL